MNFHKQKKGKYGLQEKCKICRSEKHKIDKEVDKKLKYKSNPFKNIDVNKVWNNCPFCIKVCNKCGKILVANSNNFYKAKTGKYGLETKCKVCINEYKKQYDIEHKEEIKEYREGHKKEKKNI